MLAAMLLTTAFAQQLAKVVAVKWLVTTTIPWVALGAKLNQQSTKAIAKTKARNASTTSFAVMSELLKVKEDARSTKVWVAFGHRQERSVSKLSDKAYQLW